MKTLSNYIKQQYNHLSLVAVGDILAHDCILQDMKHYDVYDFKPLFINIKNKIKKYDLSYCNQESPIGGKNMGVQGGTYRPDPKFNSPEELGDAVIDAGFNLISLSNNHAMDLGVDQIRQSIDYWAKQSNVITAGQYNSQIERDNIKIHKKNGIKYAFISYNTRTRHIEHNEQNKYLVNLYDKDIAKKDITFIKDKVDLIIVSIHWGEEYARDVSKEQREIATYLSELGVDIIIGAHTHTILPVEYINNTLVIYSLGNFISFRDDVEMKRVGLMMDIDINIKNGNKIIKTNPNLIYIDADKNLKNFNVKLFDDPNLKLRDKDKIKKKYLNIVRKYDKSI